MEQENKIPQHVVFLPDGNRRWAKEKGLDTLEGHKAGYGKLIPICTWCRDRGAKIVTAYGFSSENWNRSDREVSYLMDLLEQGLREHFSGEAKIDQARLLGVRVRVIGQKFRLPQSLQDIIANVEERTKHYDKFFLNLAISYGGRWDIVQAAQQLLKEKFPAEELTEEKFGQYLSTSGLADPDLVIRTGGAQRLSNFLLWQSAYAELYFCEKYWPDFEEQDLQAAFDEYASRSGRFGH